MLFQVDLDLDGKPDLVVFNSGSNSISIFRNTSIVGTISLAARQDFNNGQGGELVINCGFERRWEA